MLKFVILFLLQFFIFTSASQQQQKEAVLYVAGIFDAGFNETYMQSCCADIASSGFTTVILAFLHFHSDSTFWYNDVPLANATFLKTAVTLLKQQQKVESVLFSIGGAGVDDFDNIHAHWSNFSETLPSLLKDYGFDGVDIDIEGGNWYPDTMQNIVNLAVAHNLEVTATPPDTTPDAFWIELINATKIQAPLPSSREPSTVNTAHSPLWISPIKRLQIQTYTQFPTPPSQRLLQWANALSTVLPAEQLLFGNFLIPGFEVEGASSSSFSSSSSSKSVAALKSVFPNQTVEWVTNAASLVNKTGKATIQGVFAWDYRQFAVTDPVPGVTALAYAQAIFEGLSLSSSSSSSLPLPSRG